MRVKVPRAPRRTSPRPWRQTACAAAAVLACVAGVSPGWGAPDGAGTTSAVLSFIDAAAGGVEVVRNWPEAPSDVTIYPFVPYFWGGCPGPGAIMMLLTAGSGGPPLLDRVASALGHAAVGDRDARREIGRILQALRTPGEHAQEALKAALPWVSDLASYERWGYAVFLFVHWQGLWCAITVRAVPEGYGIPFVR